MLREPELRSYLVSLTSRAKEEFFDDFLEFFPDIELLKIANAKQLKCLLRQLCLPATGDKSELVTVLYQWHRFKCAGETLGKELSQRIEVRKVLLKIQFVHSCVLQSHKRSLKNAKEKASREQQKHDENAAIRAEREQQREKEKQTQAKDAQVCKHILLLFHNIRSQKEKDHDLTESGNEENTRQTVMQPFSLHASSHCV